MERKKGIGRMIWPAAVSAVLLLSACALVDVPDSRNVEIPSPTMAKKRETAVNERPDSVMYLPLGEDVLVPEIRENDEFPHEMVGPFELRGETLAGALQLILADYDISLTFETQEGLTRRITVANLRGDLGKVVNQVCSLANLYCSYEDGSITVKDTQTFTVTLPPLGSGDESEFLDDVAAGLGAILGTEGGTPIVDPTTRTLVYAATQRTADVASRYFQRLRANTAMIVFETYIWEVSLNSGNSTGIDWEKMASFGKFNTSINITGDVSPDFTSPISIGLPTTDDISGNPSDIIEFLSQFGAVKTISQPQITVLSGSEAELRVADTQNYVSQIATTLSEGQATTSVNTDSVDTGFTLTIGSSWDKSTVYANVEIELTDVKQIDDFAFADTPDPNDPDASGTQTRIQLPQTSERQLSTQLRMRPGDSMLIAGLVRENDNFDEQGPGFMEPVIPSSRTAQTENLELVILLRPRVVVYTAANDKRYLDFAQKKHKLPGTGVEIQSPKELGEPPSTELYIAPVTKPIVSTVPVEPVSSAPVPVMPAPVPLVLPPPPVPIAPVVESEPMEPMEPTPMPMLAEEPASVKPPVIVAEPMPAPEPVVSPAPAPNASQNSAALPMPGPAPVLTQTAPVQKSGPYVSRRKEGFVSSSRFPAMAPSSVAPQPDPEALDEPDASAPPPVEESP